MAKISDEAIARALKAAGWPSNVLSTAVAVALAESGGDPTAKGGPNSNGSYDYGLMQINGDAHADKLKTGNWQNPVDNAVMGLAVYRGNGNKFDPPGGWSVYPAKSALYQPRGVAAARKVAGEPAGAPVEAPEASTGSQGAGGAFTMHNALRAAMVASGAVLLLLVLGAMVSGSDVGKAAIKMAVTKKVAKGAVKSAAKEAK